MADTSLIDKANRFSALHLGPDLLLLPNVWDTAGACLLAKAGHAALATSSAAIAWSLGYPDGEYIPRDEMLAAVRRIATRVNIPVTADLESAYGRDPELVAQTVRQAITAGAVGCNIEDSVKRDPRDAGKVLFDLPLAVERIRAARAAADSAGLPFVVNARVDSLLKMGHTAEANRDAIARGNAYAGAGARCVFVPGAYDKETIALLVREVAAPLNILAGPGLPSMEQLRELGVRRLSLGAWTLRAAYSAVLRLAEQARQSGQVDLSGITVSNQQVNDLLKE